VFPKLVFAIRDGLNHKFGDPNYDIKQLALECASKRMYPDILNYDQVVKVTGSFKTPMGCRSFLGVYEENGEQIHDGRNNLGVISLNLPRIALEAKGDEATFWKLLDNRLELARKALMTRIASGRGESARGADPVYGRRLRRAPESRRRRLRDFQKRSRVHFAGLYRHPRNHQRAVG
jgi:ribonucleoside-triphosphate reductase